MAIKNAALNRLQSYFNIGMKPNTKVDSEKVYPLEHKRTVTAKGEMNDIIKQKFSDESKALFQFWLSSTLEAEKQWKSRECLWDDMQALYYNCQPISRAVELIVDETIQADTNDQPIFIDAKRPVKKYIQDLFDYININSLLRPTLKNIVQFGNAGWILGFDDEGINEVVNVDIRSIKDRLEFSPYEVKREIQKASSIFSQFSKISRMQSLIDSMMDKEEATSYFKKYLFGFQIEDKILPPWKFIHFRNATTESPFAPFGIPLYIHAMAAYKQYDAAMTLINAARVASFPKQVVEINLPNQMDPATKIEKAMEAMAEWLNIGFGTSKKELPGLGDTIFTIRDLFDFKDVKTDVDLGNLADLDKLWDQIVISTYLPRYIIDPRDSGFGDTGVALIEKWKPFARLVYRMQTILLENITQLVKIHMLYTGKFSIEDTQFTLSMKYPESQINQDIVSSQNSMLDLVNNIIASIQDKITGGELLPPELIKSLYTQFLPYDTSKIEGWIDDAVKAKADKETVETVDSLSNEQEIDQLKNPDEFADISTDENIEDTIEQDEELKQFESIIRRNRIKESIKSRKRWSLLEKRYGKIKLKEEVNEIIFEESFKVIRDAKINGRHIFSSKNRDASFPAEQLREFDLNRVKKLKESENDEIKRLNEREEFQYNFTFSEEDQSLEDDVMKLEEEE